MNFFKKSALRIKSKFIHDLIKIETTSEGTVPPVEQIELCLRTYYIFALRGSSLYIKKKVADERIAVALRVYEPWVATYDDLALVALFRKYKIRSVKLRQAILKQLASVFHYKSDTPPYQSHEAYCCNLADNLQITNSTVRSVVYGDSMQAMFRRAVDLNIDDLCGGVGSVWVTKDLEVDKLVSFMGGRGVPRSKIKVISEDTILSESFLLLHPLFNSNHDALTEVVWECMYDVASRDGFGCELDELKVAINTISSLFKLAVVHNEPTLFECPTLRDYVSLSKKHGEDNMRFIKSAFGLSCSISFDDYEPSEYECLKWESEYEYVREVLSVLKPILGMGNESVYESALSGGIHYVFNFENRLIQFAVAKMFHLEKGNRSSYYQSDFSGLEKVIHKVCPVFVDTDKVVTGAHVIPSQVNGSHFVLHSFFGDEYLDLPYGVEEFTSATSYASHFVISKPNPCSFFGGKVAQRFVDLEAVNLCSLIVCSDQS